MSYPTLTVSDIVQNDSLRSRIVAGHAGLNRRVTWAHSCALEAPWRWVGEDELILTDGQNIPEAAHHQAEFIREIHARGIAALALPEGDNVICPPVHESMIRVANQLDFPILITEQEIPWSAITRFVAIGNIEDRALQTLTLAKILQLTIKTESPDDLLLEVSRLLQISLDVEDSRTKAPLIENSRFLRAENADVYDAGPSSLSSSSGINVPTKVQIESDLAFRPREIQLNTVRPCVMHLHELQEELSPDSLVLLHVTALIENLVNSRLTEIMRAINTSDEALRTLLFEGKVADLKQTSSAAAAELSFRIVVFDLSTIGRITFEIGRDKRDVHVTNLEVGAAYVPEKELDGFRNRLQKLNISAAVSDSHRHLSEINRAVDEARHALKQRGKGQRWAEYVNHSVSVLARSESEARTIVTEVLGELTSEQKRMAALRETLFTYLTCNRSWKQAAQELRIHRQTLAYRLEQIEVITGRSLANVSDLAALWIAFQAWNLINAET